MAIQTLIFSIFSVLAGLGAGGCCGLTFMQKTAADPARRTRASGVCCALFMAIGGLIGLLWCFVTPPPFSVIASAPTYHRNDPSRSVFVGNGCFWHTQYDFVVLEQDASGPFGGRSDSEVTSLVGYGGGRYQSASGAVCYHGFPGTDYSRLGHAEAVSIALDTITGPSAQAQVSAIAKIYFEHGFRTLSDGRRQRLDPQDVGAEYRNVIGLPGGMDNEELWPLLQAANVYNMTTVRGAGGLAGDTEGEFIVYVYDSTEFPFFRGEASHQFHRNSVIGRPVPTSYLTTLKDVQSKLGRLDEDRGCVALPFAELTLLIIFAFAAFCGAACALLHLYWKSSGLSIGNLLQRFRVRPIIEDQSIHSDDQA